MRKIILFMTITLAIAGCSLPSNPGIPTWETELHFYVLNDSYDILELAEEDSAIVLVETAAGDTVLGIYQEENNTQAIEMGATEVITETETSEIGDIALPEVNTISGLNTFQEFADASGEQFGDQGVSVPEILPFNFGKVQEDLNPIEEIETVTVLEGSMQLVITNNMIVILGNYEGGSPYKVRLVHIAGGDTLDVIEQIILNDRNIGIGETFATDIDLYGVTLYKDMSLLMTGGSLGTDGEPTTIDYLSELYTLIDFQSGMTASSANAMIAEQTIMDTMYLEFDEDYSLYEAELLNDPNYELAIHVVNQLDIDLRVLIEIPSLFPAGSPEYYTTNFTVERNGGMGLESVKDTVIYLGGAELRNNDELLETIDIYSTAFIDSTEDGDYRQIEESNSYIVDVNLSEMEFNFIRGLIKPQEQEPIEQMITLDINYPEIEEGGQFCFVGESSLTFDVNMGDSQIPGELVLDVRGYSQNEEEIQLIDNNTGDLPVITLPGESSFAIVIDSETHNLNELLSILPKRIELLVNITAGDGETELIYHSGNMMTIQTTLESTLALASEAWVIPTEDGESKIAEEEIALEQQYYDAFQGAEILLTYINTTGSMVNGEILLSDTREHIAEEIYNFDNPDMEVVDIISIPALAETGIADSLEMSIIIEQEDLGYLLEDISYIGSRLRLVSTGEQALSGEVKLTAKVKLKVNISDDLISGEE
ncbi:MAG: hypothetical protein K9N06_05590 [Candidatus Cloacimonetes bacterium]|nr:hypothetical protein [Candidatus Cloacimonadota bacterium]